MFMIRRRSFRQKVASVSSACSWTRSVRCHAFHRPKAMLTSRCAWVFSCDMIFTPKSLGLPDTSVARNGVAMIFFWGGPPGTFSSPLRGSRPHSVGGGGGSSRNFRYLGCRIGFSGGGGVVAEIFPVNRSMTFPRFRDILGTFSAHLRIVRRLWTLAEVQGHFPCLLTHSNHVTTSIHSGKKHLQ